MWLHSYRNQRCGVMHTGQKTNRRMKWAHSSKERAAKAHFNIDGHLIICFYDAHADTNRHLRQFPTGIVRCTVGRYWSQPNRMLLMLLAKWYKITKNSSKFKVHVIQFKMLHFNFLITFINVQQLSAKDDFCFCLLIIDQVQIPSVVSD